MTIMTESMKAGSQAWGWDRVYILAISTRPRVRGLEMAWAFETSKSTHSDNKVTPINLSQTVSPTGDWTLKYRSLWKPFSPKPPQQ